MNYITGGRYLDGARQIKILGAPANSSYDSSKTELSKHSMNDTHKTCFIK